MQKRHFIQTSLLSAILLTGFSAHAQTTEPKAVVQHCATLVHANHAVLLQDATT